MNWFAASCYFMVHTNIKKTDLKKATIAILNMFDVGVIHLIEGNDIDRPRNAMTLSLEMHRFFGSFEIFFDRVADDDAS